MPEFNGALRVKNEDSILGAVRRALSPPTFSSEEDSRRAQILNAGLLLTIVAPPILIAVNVVVGRASVSVNVLLAALAAFALMLEVPFRRGQIHRVSLTIVVVLFLYAVAASVAHGTVRTPATVMFLIDVSVAGVLLGRRAIGIVATASTAAYAGLLLAEARGWLPAADFAATPGLIVSFAALNMAVGGLTYLALREVEVALHRADVEVKERRRAEADLEARDAERRSSEERYRLISEVISDYTFSSRVDASGNLELDWVAGAFEAITGYGLEEYVARGGWRAELHPDDVAQDERDMAQLRRDEPIISELRTLTRGGVVRWVRVYGHPVWDADKDQLAGIYGAVQDIDERKRVEVERERLIRELEGKNQELEAFTYAVSHDLRSPIITIRGFLGFMGQHLEVGDTAALRADMERVLAATGKMDRLLTELLDLSRVGRIVNSPGLIDLEELVGEAREQVAGSLRQARISIDVEPDLPGLYGDRPRLVQVMQNLLDNAAKFMGDEAEPRVGVSASGGDDEIVVRVRDNGIGIAPRLQSKVFDLFEKLDADSSGTGVGLALVRKIVESHGGRVFVESEGVGHGSTFGFSLPRAPGRTSTNPESS